MVEVLVVRFVVYALLARLLLCLAVGDVEATTLPAAYLVGALWFVVPLGIILLGRRSLAVHGLTVPHPRVTVDVGLNAFVATLVTTIGYLAIMAFGWSYQEPAGALFLTGLYLVALVLVTRQLARRDPAAEEPAFPRRKHQTNVVVIAGLLAFPVVLGAVLGRFSWLVVSTVVWQFTFSGFGEEVFFRGYTQGRLNAAFGRPYAWRGVQFGPGLFITAALFAVTHVLNPADLYAGHFEFAWWWGTFTFVGGVLFGLLREKTGSVVAPGIVHGLEAVGEALALVVG